LKPKRPLEDSEVIDVLAKEAKKRKDSATAYEQGGRPELAAQEIAEAEMISKYLPEQLGEDAIREIIKATITELGASSMADMGKVIGAVVGKLKAKQKVA